MCGEVTFILLINLHESAYIAKVEINNKDHIV